MEVSQLDANNVRNMRGKNLMIDVNKISADQIYVTIAYKVMFIKNYA